MSFHTCWGLKPTDGQPGMPLEEFLARLADSFPIHKFDPETARQNALRRLAALQAITKPVPIPEEILAYYRDACPVDVVLADGPVTEAAVLSFTVWPEGERCVSRVLAYFATEEHQQAGCVLLARLAEVLGWETEDVIDEVE